MISKDYFRILDQIVFVKVVDSLQNRPCNKFCDYKSNIGSFNGEEEILQSLDAEFHDDVDPHMDELEEGWENFVKLTFTFTL